MTKEITKAFILQQIQDKFKLRELMPEKFSFGEMVIPVYDVGIHLMTEEVKAATDAIGSLGGGTSLVVPQNERWHLHGYNVIFMTGVYTVAGVMIYRPLVADYIYIDLKAAQSVSYSIRLANDIILHPGHKLVIYVDGYTSTGNLQLRADVSVEEIR